jgi:hypothetical protein
MFRPGIILLIVDAHCEFRQRHVVEHGNRRRKEREKESVFMQITH